MKIILALTSDAIYDAWRQSGGHVDVEVFRGSIFDAKCSAIVSPANSFGFMDGGLDYAIRDFYGKSVEEDIQWMIQQRPHQEILVGEAIIYYSNFSGQSNIIVAPTMRVPMRLKDSINVYLATRAALWLANAEGLESVAFPAMGTGVGKMPPADFCRQFIQAVYDFQNPPPAPTSFVEATKRHLWLLTGKPYEATWNMLD